MKQAEQCRDTRLESQQPPLPPAKPHVLEADAAERQRQHAEYQHRLHVADTFPDSPLDSLREPQTPAEEVGGGTRQHAQRQRPIPYESSKVHRFPFWGS